MTAKYTTIIRIIIAALAISMLVAGPNIALLQQHQGYAAPQTKKQEQNTIQGLRGNLAKRSTTAAASQQQHINQENQCLRTGKCGNADLGQQTLGNDNSITGFTDQSKNVQAAVTPTPTPTLTSIPHPTTLEVIKRCTPSCSASTFSIHVTGPLITDPSSFSLKDGDVQFVRFAGGNSYKIDESPAVGFGPPQFASNCEKDSSTGEFGAAGTVNEGGTAFCIITNIRSTLTILHVSKRCESSMACIGDNFSIHVTGPNNPQPSSFSLTDSESKNVFFEGGTSYKIVEDPVAGFNPPLFGGDCKKDSSTGEFGAAGTVNLGEIARCAIRNVRAR